MRHGVEALFPLGWFDTRLAVYSVSVLSLIRPGVPNVCVCVKKCCQEVPLERQHDITGKQKGIEPVDWFGVSL